MKLKKLFAVTLAATLVVLPTSNAFADQTTINGVNNTYQATVNYVDPTQSIRMVVPTNASLAFTLDPQHLAATQGVGSWTPGDGGDIIPASVVQIVNKSAIPVKAQVSLSLVDSADDKVVLVEDDSAINTGTAKNMNLTLTPADDETSIATTQIDAITDPIYFQDGETPADVTYSIAQLDAANVAAGDRIALADVADATFGQYVATALPAVDYKQVEVPVHGDIAATTATTVAEYTNETTGFLSATIVPVTDEGADLAFVMKKADYYVAKTAADGYQLRYKELDTNTNYDVASYIIGGSINMNADWSDYTGTSADTLTLNATYTFSKMSDTAADAALTAKTAGTYNSVTYVAPAAPSIAATTTAIVADAAEVVAVSLGASNLAATGVTSVTYNDGTLHTLVADTDYTFSGSDLTFTSAYVNSMIGAGDASVSRTFTVTFNDGATTTDTIELTYAPELAPSISATTATIAADTAEVVAVSLGSGSIAATGVTSVTYNDGTSHTLVADTDYTFSGTDLTFTSAYINTLLGDSTSNVSRTFTVTFNNGVTATTDTIQLTFTAADVAASVTPTTANFSKATGATISVNLGSGTLKATGITRLDTVVSGTDYVWDASMWTLTGSTLTLKTTASIASVTPVPATRTIKVTFSTGVTDTIVVTINN